VQRLKDRFIKDASFCFNGGSIHLDMGNESFEICPNDPMTHLPKKDADFYISELNAAQDGYRYWIPSENEIELTLRAKDFKIKLENKMEWTSTFPNDPEKEDLRHAYELRCSYDRPAEVSECKYLLDKIGPPFFVTRRSGQGKCDNFYTCSSYKRAQIVFSSSTDDHGYGIGFRTARMPLKH
jgi:hypothetical protein